MNRRTFIRSSLAAGALIASRSFAGEGSAEDIPLPCLPSAWKKQGIILEPAEAWEGSNIQNFTTSIEPLDGGAWRIWYSASGPRSEYAVAYAEGIPGQRMGKVRAVCSAGEPADVPFAIGNLPDQWKPVQPTHVQLANGKHRLYFWAHGPQVTRYLAAESEDGRRYRVLDPLRPVLYHPNDRATKKTKGSRPGNEPSAPARLISNDATTLYPLPDGSFEIYSVGLIRVPKTDPAYMTHDNAPGAIRVIDRYTSPDGIHIETRDRIIQRDEKDPVDQQFYYLSVTRTPQGCVGMLGHYRCQAQTMDLEWCFSRDGKKWQRPLRQAWIARGSGSEPDCFGIYANSRLVQRDGKWHLFYTGVNSNHNGKQSHGKPRQVIMHATADSIWR